MRTEAAPTTRISAPDAAAMAAWSAFPFGAVVGDFLDKPLAEGGLAPSRYAATATLLMMIVICILVFPQRAAKRAH